MFPTHPHYDKRLERRHNILLVCLPESPEGPMGYMLDAVGYCTPWAQELWMVFPKRNPDDRLECEYERELLLDHTIEEVAVFGGELTGSGRMLIETAHTQRIIVTNHTSPGSPADVAIRAICPPLRLVVSN